MLTTKNKPAGSFNQKLIAGITWRALNVVFAFLFNALLVHQLGAGASGQFFYLLNNLFFAALLLGVGLESGISFYNARKEISVPHLFTASITWSAVAAIIFWVVTSFLPWILPLQQNHFYLTAYLFGSLLTSFLSAIYFTQHNSKTPNLAATVTNVILIVLLPAMPWMKGKINFETYTIFYFLAPVFSALMLLLVMLKQQVFFSLKVLSSKMIMPLLRFSLHSFVISVLFSLLKRSDFWLVNRWCPVVAAGNYFQASKVIQLLLLLPALASFSLYPLIVESIKKNEEDKNFIATTRKVTQLVGLYFIIAVVLSAGILVSGFWIFPLLYGASFGSLYGVTLCLVPGLIFFAATYPLTTYFAGKNQNTTTILYLCIAIAVLIAGNFILTPQYFIYGAAISNSIANMVYFFLMTRRFLVLNTQAFTIKDFMVPVNIAAVSKKLFRSHE